MDLMRHATVMTWTCAPQKSTWKTQIRGTLQHDVECTGTSRAACVQASFVPGSSNVGCGRARWLHAGCRDMHDLLLRLGISLATGETSEYMAVRGLAQVMRLACKL